MSLRSPILCLLLAAPTQAAVDFTTEVRPIIAQHCLKCHGPDTETLKGDLRLDLPEHATRPAKSGRRAIVPGQPEQSELMARVLSHDPDEQMPPPEAKKPLTTAQIETLRAWIREGAEYRPHWAFLPPRATPAPAGAPHPVDAFLRERRATAGLASSPPADRATLLRRVSLDLTGLPPSPEETAAFLADPSPDAYEKVVDRLLASPRYGERWARRWLDLARYADTNGYEKDRARTIWPWRDWVIRALNEDMPFDRFSIEQLAGDLLPNATQDQRVATGFHRNTMINEEGGIDPLEFRFHAMTDRVSTTGATWLGLTLQCAQCHTHKFDPITHTEYYGLMAFLNNADEPELELTAADTAGREARRLAELDAKIDALAAQWPLPDVHWAPAVLVSATAQTGQKPESLPDGELRFPMPPPERDTWTLVVEVPAGEHDRVRLEALTDDLFPSRGPGRADNGNFVLSEFRLADEGGGPLAIASATADANQASFPVEHAIDGKPDTGWAVHVKEGDWHKSRTAEFRLAAPLVSGETRRRLVVTLDQQYGSRHLLGKIRLSFGRPETRDVPPEQARRSRIASAYGRWLEQMRAGTVAWTALSPTGTDANLSILLQEADHTLFAVGDMTKSDSYVLRMPAQAAPVTAFRLEALPDPRLPNRGPGRVYYEGPKGSFFLSEFRVTVNGVTNRVVRASHSHSRPGAFGAQLAIDGDPQSGWDIDGGQGRAHQAVFVLENPLPAGTAFVVELLFERYYAAGLGRFRLWATSASEAPHARDFPVELEADLAAADSGRLEGGVFRRFLLAAPPLAGPAKPLLDALRIPPREKTTLVMQERPDGFVRETHRHHRGEFLQAKEQVSPGTPAVLHAWDERLPKNRLGFAQWLMSPDNPLTPRVVVNRQWAAFFGEGIVRTVADFGLQSDAPTHPELLDWLALEFVKQGWSLKTLNRLLVTSEAYRQSSRVSPEHLELDAANRWLARAPRPRLEAEMIRDASLAVSGLLSGKMYGPGVFPPQPSGITTEGAYGALTWTVSGGEDRYRRGLYTYAKRTAPYAMTSTFDAPSGEACLAQREVSNTALQALTMLNDEVVLESARALGSSLASAQRPLDEGVRELVRRCLNREADAEEIAVLGAFWTAQHERFRSGELDPAPLAGKGTGDSAVRAAWTALARALLNTDEFITRN